MRTVTIEVKIAENDADMSAGGYTNRDDYFHRQNITRQSTGDMVVDSKFVGATTIITSIPALAKRLEQCIREYESGLGTLCLPDE